MRLQSKTTKRTSKLMGLQRESAKTGARGGSENKAGLNLSDSQIGIRGSVRRYLESGGSQRTQAGSAMGSAAVPRTWGT